MLLVLCVGLSVFMEGSFTDTFAAETCEFKCGTSSPRKKKRAEQNQIICSLQQVQLYWSPLRIASLQGNTKRQTPAARSFGAFQHVIVQPSQFSLSENKGMNIWTYTECDVFTYTYIVCTHTRIHT